MANQTEKATCHTCVTELPLDTDHFYKFRGKFWVYRCKSCCKVHNEAYYRSKNPVQDRLRKAKNHSLGQIPKRMINGRRE